MAEAGKANRDMSAEQVEAAKTLGDTWKDLGEAVRATRDLIGSLFVGGAQTRADWLIKLVDGSRELFRTWAALADQKRQTFLEGLGESPTELLFKTLVAAGEQLAGIWRGVLVPAGNKIVEIIESISGSLTGVSKSQVAAFFITAAVAAAALAVALKLIGFALTPISLLLSLFTGFGPILIALGAAVFLFWDQFAAAASAALKLIPQEFQAMKEAFQLLFKGDVTGFWDKFSTAASSAFQKVKQAILQTDIGGTIVAGFQRIAAELPGAIELILQAFVALGTAATGVANAINRIFGTQLTGTDIAVIAIVAQMTGALQALAAVATVVGGGLTVLVAAITLVGIAFGATTAAFVGGAALIAAALAGIVIFWDQIAAGAQAAFNAVVNFSNALDAAVWDAFKSAGVAAWEAISGAAQSVIGVINSVIESIGNAIAALQRLLTMSPERGGSLSDTGGFAGGGFVRGRGTGTSDSNLAWVSRGEHIMPARSVRQPGVLAFLEALRRSGGNLSRVMDRMGRFASGGLVLPSFAAGGLASAAAAKHISVDLRTNAGTFTMMTDEGTAEALTRVARRRDTHGMTKPSWYR
jgi:hypothetical protein